MNPEFEAKVWREVAVFGVETAPAALLDVAQRLSGLSPAEIRPALFDAARGEGLLAGRPLAVEAALRRVKEAN